MRRVEDLTDGAVSMGPGTLYGSIKRMLADGLIEETAERPDPELDDERRRYYRVTADGERARADELARMESLLRRAASPRFGERVMSSVRIYRALRVCTHRASVAPTATSWCSSSWIGCAATAGVVPGAAVRDLTISTPHRYWETTMNASPQTKLVIAAVVTSVAAIFFLLVGGAILALALLLLVGWQLCAILRMRGHRLVTQQWWKFAERRRAVRVAVPVLRRCHGPRTGDPQCLATSRGRWP